jgi:hypothetical protein
MDEHSRLGIKINYRKRKIDDRSSLGKAVQYLEKARLNKMYNFHLADLYSLMQRLFIVGKYHKTIALLNKYKCWACEEGLPQGYSMHDCEQEFYIQVECHFDEATFLVNDEIRNSKFFGFDSHFLEVEMLEEGVWHLLGVSFIYIIKQRLYMRTINSGFYIMGT